MFDFFSQLRKKKEELRTTAHNEWTKLVVAVAAAGNGGKSVDQAEVLKTLERLDRTDEELEKAVKALLKRRAARERIKQGAEAEKEIAKLNTSLAKVHNVFKPVEAKYESDVQEHQQSLQHFEFFVRKASDAVEELIKTSTDEPSLANIERLAREQLGITREVIHLASEVDTWKEVVGRRTREHAEISVNLPDAIARSETMLESSRKELKEASEKHREAVGRQRAKSTEEAEARQKLMDCEL